MNSSEDPFNSYGFGIIAYFKLLRYLMGAYVIISAMAVALMLHFAKGDALAGDRNALFGQFTLGNLGLSHADCINQNIGIEIE